MIYANGNNELEPEIWQSRLDIEKVVDDTNCNILLQIAREDRKLVEIIRPADDFPVINEKWTGVRRYIFKEGKAVLVKELGPVNMADPLCLYNFLNWSIKNYPAEKYMLILGGHVYQFVGALTDYSQDKPYIMGFPEMANTLQLINKRLGIVIDILVLDVCYLNFIEVLYEFGKYEKRIIKYLLTYIYDGPLSGLPYKQIMKILQKYRKAEALQLIKRISEDVSRDLVAFDINYKKFKGVKELINKLSCQYLDIKETEKPSINRFINNVEPDKPWCKDVKKLSQSLQSLIITYHRFSKEEKNLINIAQKLPDDFKKIKLYYRLAFNKGNKWFEILTNKTINNKLNYIEKNEQKFAPTLLFPDLIKANIEAMNTDLKQEILNNIYKKLSKYKNWNY